MSQNAVRPDYDPHRRSAFWGAVLGFTAAVFYTATNIFLRSAADLDPWLVSAIKTVPTVLGAGSWMFVSAWQGWRVLPRPRQLVLVAAAGLFAHFAGNLCFQFSLGVVGIALAVPLSLGMLILGSALLGRIVLLEPLNTQTILAISILLLAIGALSSGAREASKQLLETPTGQQTPPADRRQAAESKRPPASATQPEKPSFQPAQPAEPLLRSPHSPLGPQLDPSRVPQSNAQSEHQSEAQLEPQSEPSFDQQLSQTAAPSDHRSQPQASGTADSLGFPPTGPASPIATTSASSTTGPKREPGRDEPHGHTTGRTAGGTAGHTAGTSTPAWLATLGVLAACMSGFAYALLGMAIRRSVTNDVSVAAATFTVAWVGLVTLVPITTYKLGWEVWISLTREDWLITLLAGICNVIAFVALSRALQLTTLVYVNAMNASQVAMASLAGIVIFAEVPSAALAVGVSLTVLGLLAMPRQGRRKASGPATHSDKPIADQAPPQTQISSDT